MAAQLGDEDIEIRVDIPATARIRKVHIPIIRCLCDLADLDLLLFGKEQS